MPRTKKTPESIVPRQAPKKVEQKQPATNMPSFVIAIIITALFVGGIVFFGQQRIVNKNKQELDESNQRISQLTAQLNELQSVINGNTAKEIYEEIINKKLVMALQEGISTLSLLFHWQWNK